MEEESSHNSDDGWSTDSSSDSEHFSDPSSHSLPPPSPPPEEEETTSFSSTHNPHPQQEEFEEEEDSVSVTHYHYSLQTLQRRIIVDCFSTIHEEDENALLEEEENEQVEDTEALKERNSLPNHKETIAEDNSSRPSLTMTLPMMRMKDDSQHLDDEIMENETHHTDERIWVHSTELTNTLPSSNHNHSQVCCSSSEFSNHRIEEKEDNYSNAARTDGSVDSEIFQPIRSTLNSTTVVASSNAKANADTNVAIPPSFSSPSFLSPPPSYHPTPNSTRTSSTSTHHSETTTTWIKTLRRNLSQRREKRNRNRTHYRDAPLLQPLPPFYHSHDPYPLEPFHHFHRHHNPYPFVVEPAPFAMPNEFHSYPTPPPQQIKRRPMRRWLWMASSSSPRDATHNSDLSHYHHNFYPFHNKEGREPRMASSSSQSISSTASSSSSSSSISGINNHDGELAAFRDEDWTPHDSSYGAAIPLGGCIPKPIRRLIESTMLGLLMSSLLALVIVASIKLSNSNNNNNGNGSSSSSSSNFDSGSEYMMDDMYNITNYTVVMDDLYA